MIKLNWLRGKSLGLALIYLGIMGLFQIIFVAIAQYGMKVGSQPISILVPIAVILATFYCVLALFESGTTMNEYRNVHRQHQKKYSKGKLSDFVNNIYVRPLLIVCGVFTGIYFLTWLILFSFIEKSWVEFIINDNVAAFAVIILVSFLERSTTRRTR